MAKSMSSFIRSMFLPYVVNLRDLLAGNLKKVWDKFDVVDQDIVDTNDRLDETASNLNQQIAAVGTDLTTHINDKNDPHQTKLAHIATISTLPPSDSQGSDGDTWVELL